MATIDGTPLLLREVVDDYSGDSTFDVIANWPAAANAQNNAGYSCPGKVYTNENASGVEFCVRLIDTDGAPVASGSGTFTWRYAEQWSEDSSTGSAQSVAAVGREQSGVIGEWQEATSPSAGVWQTRLVSIQLGAIVPPGGDETHAQVWIRAR